MIALEQKNHKFLTLVEPKKKKKKRKKLGVDGELLIKKPKGRPKVKQHGNSLILFNIWKIRVVKYHATYLTKGPILIVLDIYGYRVTWFRLWSNILGYTKLDVECGTDN